MGSTKYSKALGDAPGAEKNAEWTNSLKRGRVPGPRMKEHKVLEEQEGDGTKCVHSGTYIDPVTGAVGTPIFQTSTFYFSDHTYESFEQGLIRDVPIYTRYGNPSVWSVQEKIASLENAESSVLFSSGMSAITTALIALTNNGGHIISSKDVYGGTFNFLREDLHQLGRELTFVDSTNIEEIKSSIQENTQVFFFETLTNPLLKPLPLNEVAQLAREHNILLLVDNTFLSPVLMKPLDYGAHIVLHSCTKYINGHSDVVAGVASGPRKYIDRIWSQMLKFGGSVNPMTSFLLERGLKTLDLRMEKHSENANGLAAFLENHAKVKRVYHPSLQSYPYDYLDKYCNGRYGGVVSFEVEGGDQAALRLLEYLKLPVTATSLGGVESLISLPFNTSHSLLTEKQKNNIGIFPGLVRLSVGIENLEDLKRDFNQALNKI